MSTLPLDHPSGFTDNRRGIFMMLVAMALFMASDICLKLASSTMPVGQILYLRGLISVPLLLVVMVLSGQLSALADIRRPAVLGRAALDIGVAGSYITALSLLPIADVTAIGQATPLLLTILVVMLGLERVGIRRWLAVMVGLVGVVLIMRPGLEGFRPASFVALASSLLVALRDLATRRIAGSVSTIAITLASIMAVTLAGGTVLSIGETWVEPNFEQMRWIVASGFIVLGGNYAMVAACRGVDLAAIAPYRYSVVVWGVLAGIVIWGDRPHVTAMIGALLVVGSGLYTLHREQTRARGPGPRERAP